MADTIILAINGQEVEAKKGATILEAARSAGIYIPSLCYYPGLRPLPEVRPDMACQLCIVEVNGKVVLSCSTMAADGMRVETETLGVKELRRTNLTDILRRHPNACLTCHRFERCEPFDICLRTVAVSERCVLCPANQICELQKVLDHIGLEELPAYISKDLPIREDSPFFLRDHNLCIRCERCVRVCEDIRGVRAIEFAFPCQQGCPADIDIPRYLHLIARGRPGAAIAVNREKVPFPGVLGRVCIHPCETACQRGLVVDKPLQIRMLKRFAYDNSDDSWKKLAKRLPPTGKSLAVVGAGPAGLTVAYYLAKLGHKVTVFDALRKPGGMMLAGIPEYRLPRRILDSEIEEIKNVGVEIKLNTPIKSLDSLFKQGYNAIFLGLGAHQGLKLGVEGENLPGVIESIEFLRRANLGEKINVGERVGVIGGGNVAIDSARMSLRFGAKKVTIFYRRSRAEMPASPEEVEGAIKEGVEIIYLATPSKVTRDNNTLKLECVRMELGEPDASGRPRPIPVNGSEFITELDTLLTAIGQKPEVPAELGVELEKGNLIKVNAEMKTSQEGVFAGGDCVIGPASVIESIAAARKAAEAIDRYLGGTGDISESLVPEEEATMWLEGEPPEEKYAPTSHLPPEISLKGFDEVEQGWDWNTAVAEAQRCLRCYVITPPDEKVLEEANCQFCGACVDSCPTGALIERSVYQAGAPDRVVTTVCPYCGVGCQLNLEMKNGKIARVVPDPEGLANKGQACVKGKFGLDFVFDPSRLTVPLIKKNGKFVEATWDEALNLVASKLASYKSDELAVISSAKCTNEDNYVIQKFARAVLGTNNVDHCARLCHAPSVAGLAQSFGSGAMTNSIDDISDAACILAIGTNTTEAHPVIALEVIEAKQKGGKLIIANPREICLVKFADIWLRHRPGTDVPLIMGLIKVIVDEGLLDSAFIEKRCENFDAFRESLKNFDLKSVEKITGVPKEQIAEAARMYATNKPAAILYAMGITQHSHGTDNVIAIANLAMVTGNIGKPGSGVNPLRGQNNVQGACDMGALPNVFPGYQAVPNPAIRKKFESAWGCSLSSSPGITLTEILNAADKGQIKAIYLVGENPVLSDPQAKHVEESLEKLEFLVVQDIFLSEAAQLADVILPGASFAEKDGTFTNTERRVQRVRKAIEPIGKPDWLITCQIAQKMGRKGFDFSHPEQITDEIAQLTPSYGGISYPRLEKGGLQWPCPTTEHPGTPILHTELFTRGKGKFIPVDYKPSMELPDKDYPLILTTGRSLYHFHTGTMSRKVKGLNVMRGEELVEINPKDATALGIADGDTVKVVSRRGEVVAKAKLTEVSPEGVVFMTFHFAESPTNQLTNPALDPVSKIPEFKVCAVRVEKNGKCASSRPGKH
jgi:formate dehydrogenase alpha subunit